MTIGDDSRNHASSGNGIDAGGGGHRPPHGTVGSVETPEHRSDAADFSVDVETTAGAAVVTARGELDLHTAPRFSEALAEAEAFGTKQLTIDLAGVTFI